MPDKGRIQGAFSGDGDAYLTLHELDARIQGFEVYRWASSCDVDGSPVRWKGQEWPPLDFQISGFTWGGDAIPRPRITAGLGSPGDPLPTAFLDLVMAARGAQGAKLTTWRILGSFLEGHENADLDYNPAPDVYYIDRVLSLSKNGISWELIAPMDAANSTLPARDATRDTCRLRYRWYDKRARTFRYPSGDNICPYTGGKCFNEQGAATSAEHDHCGRRLSDCLLRLGQKTALPFCGFPTLGRTGL